MCSHRHGTVTLRIYVQNIAGCHLMRNLGRWCSITLDPIAFPTYELFGWGRLSTVLHKPRIPSQWWWDRRPVPELPTWWRRSWRWRCLSWWVWSCGKIVGPSSLPKTSGTNRYLHFPNYPTDSGTYHLLCRDPRILCSWRQRRDQRGLMCPGSKPATWFFLYLIRYTLDCQRECKFGDMTISL